MEISMSRGDRETRSFQIQSVNEHGESSPFTDALDEIYFTVKRNNSDRDYKFQKRLTDQGIVPLGNGRYQFTILPEDTNDLAFGDYDFDIEIVIEGELKKTFLGKLRLLQETTYAINEVSL